MSAQHYVVSQHGSHWKISFRGTDQGPFTSRDEAVGAAITEAQETVASGTDVEVLVQDVDRNFRSAWKSGMPAQQ